MLQEIIHDTDLFVTRRHIIIKDICPIRVSCISLIKRAFFLIARCSLIRECRLVGQIMLCSIPIIKFVSSQPRIIHISQNSSDCFWILPNQIRSNNATCIFTIQIIITSCQAKYKYSAHQYIFQTFHIHGSY